jgi:hypothetical protein
MKKVFSLNSFFLALSIIFLSSACQKPKERDVIPAFYHWKSTVDISNFEANYLKAISAKRIYLRFFDVDWDGATGQPLPIASVEVKTTFSDSLEIIPTVFITNRTFLNLSAKDISQLVDNILKKVNQFNLKFPLNKFKEIQFDCDWSPKTQKKYFDFLKEIKSKLQNKSTRLSSTIRLHQIKFFEKTGVPPVDRGVLMFYNMGNVEDINAENSVLNLKIAKQYLKNFEKYPLPIDIALPIFSWGVLIREGKMINLINNLRAADLRDESRFSKIDETHFEIIKSTYLQGYYLYKGDVIRLESAPVKLLQDSADLLSNLLAETELTIIFYHLDSIAINNYSHEALEDICNRFR